MQIQKIVFLLLFLADLLSACKKCPSVTLCPAANPSYLVTNGNDTASMYIPNAFTPNGDGINDNFYVSGNNIASFTCNIYNGNSLVYQIDSFNGFWNGIINGNEYVNLYTLKITGTTSWGQSFSINGTVSIIGNAFLNLATLPGYTDVVSQNTYLYSGHIQYPSEYTNVGYYNANDIIYENTGATNSIIVCH